MDIQSGLNLGADDYVTKPFRPPRIVCPHSHKIACKGSRGCDPSAQPRTYILPEIGKDLSARLNLDELTDLVLRRTVETLGAEVGHIILLNAKGPLHKEYRISTSDAPTSNAASPAAQ